MVVVSTDSGSGLCYILIIIVRRNNLAWCQLLFFLDLFNRFISTCPSVSVALRQELTNKGYFATFVRLCSALCDLLVSCIILLGASRLDHHSVSFHHIPSYFTIFHHIPPFSTIQSISIIFHHLGNFQTYLITIQSFPPFSSIQSFWQKVIYSTIIHHYPPFSQLIFHRFPPFATIFHHFPPFSQTHLPRLIIDFKYTLQILKIFSLCITLH